MFNKQTVASVIQNFQKTVQILESIEDTNATRVVELTEEKSEISSKIGRAVQEQELAKKVASNIKKLIEV